MSVYKLIDGALTEVPDPFKGEKGDLFAVLAAKGYMREVSSALARGDNPAITIYLGDSAEYPRFYVDVYGAYTTLAGLVADDFIELIAALKAIQPLIALMGLDQVADLQAERLAEGAGMGETAKGYRAHR